MILQISPEEAASAAKQILGFYPEIPASDPRGFAAGLVQTLLIFPRPVIERAINPVTGLPAKVKFLNLAAMREFLDDWMDEHLADQRRADFENRKRLPAPPPDPEMDERVKRGLLELSAHLKSGFSPGSI